MGIYRRAADQVRSHGKCNNRQKMRRPHNKVVRFQRFKHLNKWWCRRRLPPDPVLCKLRLWITLRHTVQRRNKCNSVDRRIHCHPWQRCRPHRNIISNGHCRRQWARWPEMRWPVWIINKRPRWAWCHNSNCPAYRNWMKSVRWHRTGDSLKWAFRKAEWWPI